MAMMLLAALVIMTAGCERKITGDVDLADNSSSGCFTCHGDNDVALREARIQFENSVHEAGENTNRNRLYQASYQSCEKCHTHQGFVAFATGVPTDGDHFTAIECFTCHAPHTSGSLALRVTAPVTLLNGATFDRGPANLCATCHQSRNNVITTVIDGVNMNSRYGPHHSNQGDMLIGENAYEYAGYNYTNSWHSTGVTEGCVMCHMSPSKHETVGGHSFWMRNEDHGFENISGCNALGCHDTAPLTTLDRLADADFNNNGTIEGVQEEIQGLADTLLGLLVAANLTNASGVPVSRVVATADSAGAVYNYVFIEDDRSFGVHNTNYSVGILQSAINFLRTGDPNGAPAKGLTMLSSH
jgi:hypothetical protein